MERWSWKIGSILGIPVHVHATFFLIFAWGALKAAPVGGLPGVTLATVFILALIVCVVLHELGHALAARRFGIPTRDITLLPIGGLARLERMPRDPTLELVVAIAGPLVNVAIAAVLLAALVITGGGPASGKLADLVLSGSFLNQLVLVNLFLAAFNMLPAFPMDGGRVLRALLARTTSYPRATRIAARIGQGIAVLLFLAGLWWEVNPVLILISVFVWFGAAQEASAVERAFALEGVNVRSAMLTHFRTLSPADTLSQAVELILSGSQQDFPVMESNRMLGLLTRHDVITGLTRHDQVSSVIAAMRQDYPVAEPETLLEDALHYLQEQETNTTMPVVEGGRLVGLLTLENVSEYLMIQSALGGRRA